MFIITPHVKFVKRNLHSALLNYSLHALFVPRGGNAVALAEKTAEVELVIIPHSGGNLAHGKLRKHEHGARAAQTLRNYIILRGNAYHLFELTVEGVGRKLCYFRQSFLHDVFCQMRAYM